MLRRRAAPVTGQFDPIDELLEAMAFAMMPAIRAARREVQQLARR